MHRNLFLLLLGLAVAGPNAAAAEAPVALGSAASFGILAGSTVSSTGTTLVDGDLGVWPGTAVAFLLPGAVTGTMHVNDPVAHAAQKDLVSAYNDAAGRSAAPVIVSGNIGGRTLPPGLYRSATSIAISDGDLVLDGKGDPNAVFVFQMASTLTTTSGRQVILVGGARAANVFWQVGGSATLGTTSRMMGTILADQSISMQTGSMLQGRALARGGAVTLDAVRVSYPTPPVQPGGRGTIVAWGLNSNGQTNFPTGLGDVTAVAAGEAHTVALKSDGTVAAWGLNSAGQTDLPAELANVTAIAAGRSHTVALRGDGTVAAWGDNSSGQTTVPLTLKGVTAISGGQGHTVVVKGDGTVVAWGLDDHGQSDVPAGLAGVKAVAAGGGHTLALKDNGTVVAWGANKFFFQSTVPPGLNGVVAIAAGSSHSLALKSNGTVTAWGNNLLGQSSVPSGLAGVIAIAAGEFHSLALKGDGTVVAWGWDDDGESTIPTGLGGVTAIAAGWNHSAALIGPIINTQPLGQTFALGVDLNLSVGAVGTGLTYQWLFNGKNIPNATGPILHLANPSAATAGTYQVAVKSSAGGVATSTDAILRLLVFGDLRFYAGITLAGTVGQRFRVDYADAVVGGTMNWQTLATITLPSSPYLVVDPHSPNLVERFYRAVPLPLP